MRIFDDPRFDLHEAGPGHPDSPERLVSARRGLQGLRWDRVDARSATRDELLSVHDNAHVNAILATTGRSVQLDADTFTSPSSVAAALLAAGASVDAAQTLLTGRPAYVLCRPPGHHANPGAMYGRDTGAMGFCLFNNAALAARYLSSKGHRVVVFDPDVHHGNGTQNAFYECADVLYVSLHAWPFYPGTGAASESGSGAGEGTNLNVALAPGSGDAEYAKAMQDKVLPAIREFAPDYGVISAGYDALDTDPLGGMRLSVAALATMWTDVTAICPCMAVLEGGYSPEGMRNGVAATAAVLANQQG